MPCDHPDTDALLSAAADGDQSAVEQLFQRHQPQLRRMVALRLDRGLARRVDPSDIVQDALAEGARRLEAYLARPEIPFYPWLRRIAWDKLIQLHRQHVATQRRSVRQEQPLPMQLDDQSTTLLATRLISRESTPSRAAIRDEVRQRVREVLACLSPNDREVVVLRHLEDMSFRDAAAVMGVSLSAAQSRYRRAVQRLHELLTERPI